MTITSMPPQFQWDADSGLFKKDNCRPTCEAMIASYYLNRHVSPAAMRKAMLGGSSRPGGTSAPDGVRGLESYGIPAKWSWSTPNDVKSLLLKDIPVDLSVLYAKIPKDPRYRTDFGFNGPHSVLACGVMWDSEPGLIIRDPDHGSPSRPHKPDSVFWPDRIWIPAFVALHPSRSVGCVVHPRSPKKTEQSGIKYEHLFETLDEVNVRSGPTTLSPIVSVRTAGAHFRSSRLVTEGGLYRVGSTVRRDWVGYEYQGKTIWVARGFTKLIR